MKEAAHSRGVHLQRASVTRKIKPGRITAGEPEPAASVRLGWLRRNSAAATSKPASAATFKTSAYQNAHLPGCKKGGAVGPQLRKEAGQVVQQLQVEEGKRRTG